MVEKITEIDVLCRDGSYDPVVVNVFIPTRGVELQNDNKVVEALGFSFFPRITLLSEIIAYGWVKNEPIPDYLGTELPAWKLIREKLNTSDGMQQE